MESADRDALYDNHHPYTEGLLRSLPAYGGEKERLHPIAGQPPSLITLPAGCKFHPRCPYVMDRCLSEEPALAPVEGSPEHTVVVLAPTFSGGQDGSPSTSDRGADPDMQHGRMSSSG